ncbi:MAG: hypothetical protein U5L00_12550 [Desulfovermiculus sp.]|nr:hypothetical protein [Desulfovermiculus sp.]
MQRAFRNATLHTYHRIFITITENWHGPNTHAQPFNSGWNIRSD